MRKTKRYLVVTEQALYSLRDNFTTKIRVELKNITKVFLIKTNSTLMAISKSKESSNEVDVLIETVKRTELFFFMLDQIMIFGWDKPKLLYSSALLVNKE
jgi:Unconventional myosin tail, actin- and lipid-binding